jgi:hypothetical protein
MLANVKLAALFSVGMEVPRVIFVQVELFLESTWDTTCTLDTPVSPSATGSTLKAFIFD